MKTTKNQICDAAMELFKENGYENVSIQDICNVCGVTRGSFYHHYQNKDDLLAFRCTRIIQRLQCKFKL